MSGHILVIDDDRSMGELLEAELRSRGFEPCVLTSAEAALARLKDEDFDLVLTDLTMAKMDGVELCTRIVERREHIPVIVMTAFGTLEKAIAAIRAGAYDFVTKPFDMDAFALTVDRALRHRALRDEVKRLRSVASSASEMGNILGASEPMNRVYDLMGRVAGNDTTVLITGESGTGKELIARALHAQSGRKGGPFISINCAAMPDTLLESELFGHIKGAFTDARAARPGLFLTASGGTLFLDEIGEMNAPMQAKLLRALEERKVRPVGGSEEVPFDVRLMSATNRDLETEIEEKRFREDLYYRINVLHLDLPPLRARGNDVLVLAGHFVERFACQNHRTLDGISSAATTKLLTYPWPGNVRELRNCIERAVALCQSNQIGIEDLPEKIQRYSPSHVSLEIHDVSDLVSLEEVERRHILRVLAAVGGNRTRAAHVLSVDRRTLHRKLRAFGVRLNGARGPEPFDVKGIEQAL